MEFFVLIWLLLGIAGAVVMNNKGRSGCGGFALGFLLGPIGLVIALVLSPDHTKMEKEQLLFGDKKQCPYCAELIRPEASKCRFCGSQLPATVAPTPFEELEFSSLELDHFYSHDQLVALYDLLMEDNVNRQAEACWNICKEIGRAPFQGTPRDFLMAFYNQLNARFKAGND